MEKESEKGSCCSSHGGCGGCKCMKALVLLLVGGIIGYLIGGHCPFNRWRSTCPMPMMGAPANPPAK